MVDLDTIASSIALSFLSSALQAERYIPLILTPSSLMPLRPENLLALRLSHLPLSSLLHAESLAVGTSDLASTGAHFALVDSNRLLPQFSGSGQGQVDAIIDHHEDEGLHLNAGVRVIQVPTGSCASLVTRHFMEPWKASLSGPSGPGGSPVPNELATLLLAAILIDTNGLKQGGKATTTDYESASFLYPLSIWGNDQLSTGSSSFTALSSDGNGERPPGLVAAAKQLHDVKFDVSGLSSHDLLIRDYKEYDLPTSSSTFPTIRVGLSTVPMGLKDWLEKETGGWKSLMDEVDGFMVERGLDLSGVLTTFKKKGEGRREVLLALRTGGAIKDGEVAQRVFGEIVEGMEKAEVLSLAEWKAKGFKDEKELSSGERWGKVWKQVNADATRKQVAPVIVSHASSTCRGNCTRRCMLIMMVA